MHRTNFQLDLRCGKHPDFTSDCPACCFVRRFDTEFDKLRQRRALLVRQLREKLRSGDVVVIEII
jgi:hypothetical protein